MSFYQDNDSTKIEILQDFKNGKLQPWKPKKVRSLKVADSFRRLGHEKKAMRIRFCGSVLSFLKKERRNYMELTFAGKGCVLCASGVNL